MNTPKIAIIGSGFSALAAACYLAKQGYDVQVFEKNKALGGRAAVLQKQGFTFDMGPSFYWMPDVFEQFFNDFGKTASDYYTLEKLNPAYDVYFGAADKISIGDNLESIVKTFENLEPGSGVQLKKFIAQAESNYNLAIRDLVYQPGESIFEIVSIDTIKKVGLFLQSIRQQVAKYITHPKLKTILEFPVLFLGATPSDTPAFYNFMNYADFGLGTWYPQGGMYRVIEAMAALAEELGVNFRTKSTVGNFKIKNGKITHLVINQGYEVACDILLSGADYHHTENLLPAQYRQYSEGYWDKRTLAPSALLFYVGLNKKLRDIAHHTLFFDTDFEAHAHAIYKTGAQPKNPLFYMSFPSVTDSTCAPKGKEACIALIPLAPDTEDSTLFRDRCFKIIIDRLEKNTGQEFRKHILFCESFGVPDFKSHYNSYKGNAYGLANTLLQTHVLRPRMKSKKLSNLYFTGQLTLPGPGVPPSIISGNIVSKLISKHFKTA